MSAHRIIPIDDYDEDGDYEFITSFAVFKTTNTVSQSKVTFFGEVDQYFTYAINTQMFYPCISSWEVSSAFD